MRDSTSHPSWLVHRWLGSRHMFFEHARQFVKIGPLAMIQSLLNLMYNRLVLRNIVAPGQHEYDVS